MRRLWRKDGTLWAPPGTPELEDRLGWLTIADKLLEDLPAIEQFADGVRADGLHRRRAARHGRLEPRARGLPAAPPSRRTARRACTCSTPPSRSRSGRVTDAIDVASTLFIVSSKSGGTIEPNALLAHFRKLQPDASHFVAVTDPGTSMHQLAEERGLPPHLPLRPGDRRALLGALPVRHRPGRARRHRRPRGARGRPGRGGELQPRGGQLRPLARRRARRAGRPRPRQAHVRRRPADRLLRPLGGAARRRVDGQAGPRASSRSPTSRSPPRRATATTASSSTCATRTSPTRAAPRRSRRSPRPGTRP